MDGYQSVGFDNKKIVEYFKSVVKAINKTHAITEKCKKETKDIDDALQTGNKDKMMIVLQKYIHNYYIIIEKQNIIKICYVDKTTYENLSVGDVKKQLHIMKGFIYDYEAKRSVSKELIKNCLKRVLEDSGYFSKNEIELLLG